MLYGDLAPAEMEVLLLEECYGHIGFTDEKGRPCVLPITYAYKDGAIYSVSEDGDKINAMRKNPGVCLQVEKIETPNEWKSVQAWGTFEELSGEDLKHIGTLISDFWERFEEKGVIISPLRDIATTEALPKILYRIVIDEMAGKVGGHPPAPKG